MTKGLTYPLVFIKKMAVKHPLKEMVAVISPVKFSVVKNFLF
jgi:hypothetical protein